MKRSTIDKLFLVVILAILLVPDARVAVGLVPGKLLDEKRMPFRIPDFTARLERGDATLAADVNRWFDDRYGFRDRLIRAKDELDYRLFDTSQKVAIGRDGWLFLRGHSDVLVRYERGGAAWRADIEAKLLTVADYLKARGITFIVLGIPDKSDVYPMERSNDMPVRPAVTQFDKLKADLASHPEFVYIDARDILKPRPDGPPLYWKTDIHHTFEGARLIVRALVNKIAALEGRPPIARLRRWIVQDYPIAGDLDNFMTRFSKISEDSFSYKNQYIVDQDTPEGRWSKDPRRVNVPGWGPMPPFDFVYKATSPASDGLLPTTVLFGNSFSDMYFSVGIQTYFKEFYRARNVAPRFDLSLRDLPPDTKYVVYQYFAPFLSTDMDGWQLSDLKRQARASSCLPADASPPPAAAGAGCQTDLRPTADR